MPPMRSRKGIPTPRPTPRPTLRVSLSLLLSLFVCAGVDVAGAVVVIEESVVLGATLDGVEVNKEAVEVSEEIVALDDIDELT